MPPRLSTPLRNLSSSDLKRDSQVQFDKVMGVLPPVLSCPVLNVATCEVVNTFIPVSGGSPPFVWAIVAGALPFGLTLNADGTITGTVATFAAAGPTPYTAQVTDAAGNVVLISCSAFVTKCSTAEVDHPITQNFHPAPFDGTGMTSIIYNNVPPSFAFITDVVQFRYAAGQLISNNTSRAPFLPLVPCPLVPTSPTSQLQGYFVDGFPVVFNQEASMTLGDWAYGGGATILDNVTDAIGPIVRIRKINAAFPLEFGGPLGNNLTGYGFFVQHEVTAGVDHWHSFIAKRGLGLTIIHNFPLDNVVPGDVLTIQALCEDTFLRAKINGVTVFEGGGVAFGCDFPGVAGIIGGINVPTYCDQIWSTDFSAAVRS